MLGTRNVSFRKEDAMETNRSHFLTNEIFPGPQGHGRSLWVCYFRRCVWTRNPAANSDLLFQLSLLSSIMLNVLFVYVVLVLYFDVLSYILFISGFHEGRLIATLQIIICHHQSSVYMVAFLWDSLDFKYDV